MPAQRGAPVAIILVAENLGHIRAIGAMTGRSLDRFLGRAFLSDSLATIVSAFGGGTGVTTYARPPELISLASLPEKLAGTGATVVYPDPPLGAEEASLFEAIAPAIRLRSFTEWLAEQIR